MRRDRIEARVLAGCIIIAESGCWVWVESDSGGGRGGGYPRLKLDGATVAVHRLMWTNRNGLIPPRKQIDHKCRVRCCVNPDHVEMVTHKENMKRRDAARGGRKCKN